MSTGRSNLEWPFQRIQIRKVVPPGYDGPVSEGPSDRPPLAAESRPAIPVEGQVQPWGQELIERTQQTLQRIQPGLDRYPVRLQPNGPAYPRSAYEVGSFRVRLALGLAGQRWGNWPGWTWYHLGRSWLDELEDWLPTVSTEPSSRVRLYWQVQVSQQTAERLDRLERQMQYEWEPIAECIIEGLLLGSPSDPTSLREWLGRRADQLRKVYRLLRLIYQVRVTKFKHLFEVRSSMMRDRARYQASLQLYNLVGQQLTRLVGTVRSCLNFIPPEFDCLPLSHWEQQLRAHLDELVMPYLKQQLHWDRIHQYRHYLDERTLVDLEKGRDILVWLQRLRLLVEFLDQVRLGDIPIDWKRRAKEQVEQHQDDPSLEPVRPIQFNLSGPAGELRAV